MDTKDKLCLYKGILLGHSGNSLTNRFKLMRVVRDNNVENLYAGVRIDHLSEDDFETGEIIRCDWGDSLVFVPGRGEETVFRHCPEDGYYYDLFDNETCCQLIDGNTTVAEHGCCNLRNMSYESVCGSVKVYKKEKR